jgi:hypothetical protein
MLSTERICACKEGEVMANAEQLKRLRASSAKQNGCRSWNHWRRQDWDAQTQTYWTAIDLTQAVLSRADLRGANLREAHLRGAGFTTAVLRGANLRGADLSTAVLRAADLRGVSLSTADLRQANLDGADLRGAVLKGADLTGAKLADADLTGANLQGAILAIVRGDEYGRRYEPRWPSLDKEIWEALHAEACDPETPTARLEEMTTRWPGILFAEDIARNPNISQELAIWLAPTFLAAFLDNPIVPLWFIEDPKWLGRDDAAMIMAALRGHEKVAETCSPSILALLKQCAQE